MADKQTPNSQPSKAREDRLKAALKANMAKRKAQSRARSAPAAGKSGGDTQAKDHS